MKKDQLTRSGMPRVIFKPGAKYIGKEPFQQIHRGRLIHDEPGKTTAAKTIDDYRYLDPGCPNM